MRRAVKRYTVLLELLIALGILPGCVWTMPKVCIMAGVSKLMRALLICISYATFVTNVAGNNRRVLRRIQVYR